MDDLFAHLSGPQTPKVIGIGPVVELTAAVDGRTPQTLFGRQAWALNELIAAGEAGCTPITTPGPRWSDYVFKLRRDGVSVETIDERHGGSFSGSHARYVVRSSVRLIEVIRETAARSFVKVRARTHREAGCDEPRGKSAAFDARAGSQRPFRRGGALAAASMAASNAEPACPPQGGE
jgi:hypothetical protein